MRRRSLLGLLIAGLIVCLAVGPYNPPIPPLGSEPAITPGTSLQYWRGDKSWQALPAAGVPLSTGTGFGSSYTVGTAANNLVQLNASAQLPAVSGALLTNLPGSYVNLQSSSPGTAQTGNGNITGTFIANAFSGSGANLTGLVQAQIAGLTTTDSPTFAALNIAAAPSALQTQVTFSGNFIFGTDANTNWADIWAGGVTPSFNNYFIQAQKAGAGVYFNATTDVNFCISNNVKMTLTSAGFGIGTATPTSSLQVVGLPEYADNAAALAGGLTAGAFYRTGADPDLVCVVH